MSRIIKCAKGHFYDADKIKFCPICLNPNINTQDDLGNEMTIAKSPHRINGRRPGSSFFEAMDETVGIKKMKSPEVYNGEKEAPDLETIPLAAPTYPGAAPLDDDWRQEESDDEMTVSIFKTTRKLVCGWLVCVAGEDKGRDYRICEGRNFVGRDPSMEIIIREDKAISRINHCSVVYDPKSNDTWLVTGNGSLTYYNGKLMKSQTQLHSGDIIEIGNSSLMYIGFCEGERSWKQLDQ